LTVAELFFDMHFAVFFRFSYIQPIARYSPAFITRPDSVFKAITRHGILPRHPLYKEGSRFPSASFSKEVASVSETEDCSRFLFFHVFDFPRIKTFPSSFFPHKKYVTRRQNLRATYFSERIWKKFYVWSELARRRNRPLVPLF